MTIFLSRMRRRASIVFYRAFYRRLFRTRRGRTVFSRFPQFPQPRLEG
jgi:hypothetical protein